MNENIVKIAQVESVEDDADGLRIKARLNSEQSVSLDKLPYAFPMLPKVFQSVPKVGEAVFIINAKLGNEQSNRYYIGPVISQPQLMGMDEYDYGRGSSMSLLQGGMKEPMTRISNYDNTKNAFPSKEDVAIVGRSSEDIILKNGEVDIRCGIRQESTDSREGLHGKVVRNDYDPAYIQMKYKPSLMKEDKQDGNSAVNIVADRVNIISHQTKTPYDQSLTGKGDLISDKDMDKLMKQLHPLPYGDVLVEILEKMRKAICYHLHPFPGMYPNNTDDVRRLNETDFNEVKSDFVRIS